jgi:hypothetical protein
VHIQALQRLAVPGVCRPPLELEKEEIPTPLPGDGRTNQEADRIEVSVQMFIMAFGVGATALAIWTDYRLRGVRPSTLRIAMLHVALAMLVARFVVPVALQAVGSIATAMGSVFLIGLPASVYCLLATLWILRQLGDTLGNTRQGPGSGIRS